MLLLTSYAASNNSNGFVFDTATNLTLPNGLSLDDIASSILCFTDAIFEAMSTATSVVASEGVDILMFVVVNGILYVGPPSGGLVVVVDDTYGYRENANVVDLKLIDVA